MASGAVVGVIGGSGFYSLLDNARHESVDTPYGAPSDAITLGALAGREVAFLPRHGAEHRFAPHVVPYQANLWALRSLGVRQVVALSAVGSLTTDHRAGDLVVPDQIVDRTSGRQHTFFGSGHGVGHAGFADPYCRDMRAAAVGSSPATTDGGTLVVVNGPRFSSRAESQEFQRNGWRIIGMTAMPEASLARELGLCYLTLALVTDLDAGVEAGEGVSHAEVLAAFALNLPRLRELLVTTIDALPMEPGDCGCAAAAGAPIPH
ncbi:MAG TPA: S-methyl-5'-thioadenosine phosphorylase [Jatrophihabitantaceae bacterium]|jgi:5'-methylthioadenosine phosphorylase|nr:S-methyl-5'-thioadenosine phosphorylase [Jatrophihabitantaceae bacterium]